MSIPTRVNVLMPDGTIHRNRSFFTISYGTDLSVREEWLWRLEVAYPGIEQMFPGFESIEVPSCDLLFRRDELK